MNNQPRHICEKNNGVEDIFKLEVLHDSLVATRIHSHIELLENKHPLEVKYDDEDVSASVEILNVNAPVLGILLLQGYLICIQHRVSGWVLINSKTVVYSSLVFL